MGSNISIGGLISGIDTNGILDQLYQLAQAPILRLNSRKSSLQNRSVAWSQLEGRLLNLRTVSAQLASPATFAACLATTSKPDLVTASATTAAVPGSYVFTVEALAQTHQLASQGYADTGQTEVGSGTITITIGDGDPVVIDVDNYTLAELREAINEAEAGVTAAIINDGGATTPYRLIITSRTSGTEGEIDLVPSLTGGTPPAFSDLQVAQDASLKLGSGAGAITITSSTNTIKDAISGVTLNLRLADPATSVTLTVAEDTAKIQNLVTDFVAAYNAMVEFFGDQFYYDPDSNASGVLFGDYRLQALQRYLGAAVTGQVAGLSGGLRALAEVGITSATDGRLTLNSATLSSAVANQLDDVMRLFAAAGKATDSAVQYLTATADTAPSGLEGYAVEITQAAAQARVTAGVAQTEVLVADETVTLSGVAVSLTAGMTQAEVIEEINSHQTATGLVASATGADGTGEGNYLTISRAAYGSAYHVEGVSSASNQGGNATSGLGNVTVTEESPSGESGTGTGASGLDVEGTIGGEEAAGSGQLLTASEGGPKGMCLLVTATAPGSYGSVMFTAGVAEAAFRVVLDATDITNGTVAIVQSYLTDSITEIDSQIARLQDLIAREQERLRASFARMEVALAQFQAQSQYLAGQLGQIEANSSS